MSYFIYIYIFIYIHTHTYLTYVYWDSHIHGSVVDNLPVNEGTQEMQVQSLGQEDLLEKEMANYSRILPRKIPWTKEPGGLHSP